MYFVNACKYGNLPYSVGIGKPGWILIHSQVFESGPFLYADNTVHSADDLDLTMIHAGHDEWR